MQRMNVEEVRKLNEQIFGNKVFDLQGLRQEPDDDAEQANDMQAPKDMKKRKNLEKFLTGFDHQLKGKTQSLAEENRQW